jgi:GxxExxY protein
VITQKYINDIAYKVVGCAIEVHKHMGPGLLESVYHTCLAEEFRSCNLNFQAQMWLPVKYKSKKLEGALKLDFLIENLVVLELKAVDIIIPVYKAQLLSYLKLSKMPKGLLINFHSENIVQQMVPLVTEEFSKLPKE